jgi:SAM-dependent methyltransferase
MRLEAEFGAIDIYLFDQILRDRIRPDDRVVDVGCGFGRNLVYLMRMGCELFGVDSDPDAIAEVRHLAARLAPRLPPENFRIEGIERSTPMVEASRQKSIPPGATSRQVPASIASNAASSFAKCSTALLRATVAT